MTLKKALSIVLASLMLLSVFSIGFTGMAADINLDAQYDMLAKALKNDYVRTLTNYTVVNNTLDNGKEGFDSDANGFAYEHRVVAADNKAGDILKAANRFYFIAENLMSTTYGIGLYDASRLVKHISDALKPYFENEGATHNYVDFYGVPKVPTEEELREYEEAVSLIEANGKKVNEATLTSMGVFFIERTPFEFYNVDTVLQYFMGNVLKINAGNWYHRFAFVVETSIDTWLLESGDLNNLSDNVITTRTAVYEVSYKRTYNDIGTKAYYSFEKPTLNKVWQDYAMEYGLNRNSDDLTKDTYGYGITAGGQASAFMIKQSKDEQTVPYLTTLYNTFYAYISKGYNEETGETWDLQFSKLKDADLPSVSNSAAILKYIDEITHEYSNDALLSIFGDDIGNMVTLAYILTPSNDVPERTVRGTAKYKATPEKLDSIVKDMDALVTPRDGQTGAERDNDVATRVGNIVKEFFNTNSDLFVGTSVEGMEFNNLHELVGLLVQGLVFRDSIITMLVQKIYPMITKVIQENVLKPIRDKTGISLTTLLNDIIKKNGLAIFPSDLANILKADNVPAYNDTINILSKCGRNWDAVNFEALSWGVDDAPIEQKARVFTEAVCDALGGFTNLLVTIMCGNNEYKSDARPRKNNWHDKNEYDDWYNKCLLVLVGSIFGSDPQGVYLRAQGGYTKLVIPLMRVLGLEERTSYSGTSTGYVTSEVYHQKVDEDGDNCLKLIVEPIIYWVTDILGTHPFETLWNLLPNLVYFFSRESDVPVPGESVWCSGSATSSDAKKNMANFSSVQTHNLWTILSNVFIHVTVLGSKVYSDSLGNILSKQAGMLSSINGLLNEVVKLKYKTDTIDHVDPAGYLMKTDYTNDSGTLKAGTLVIVNSAEYELHKEIFVFDDTTTEEDKAKYMAMYDAYMTVYSNITETSYSTVKDDKHTRAVDNVTYVSKPYKIPAIQEGKLTSCGTVKEDWNTLVIEHPGQVLLYVLRYVCSALGYKYDLNLYEAGSEDYDLPYLAECFGLKTDKELFNGLKLGDIIYNVMLHPDDAICALLEIFYSNENGDFYTHRSYTYPVKDINYHQNALLNKTVNPTLSYGTQVTYSKYWTRQYASEVVANAGQLVENIMMMLGMKDFENGIGSYLENMLNKKVFNNALVNKLFNKIYQLLSGLNKKINVEVLLKNALDVDYTPLTVAKALKGMTGTTAAYYELAGVSNWSAYFTDGDGNTVDRELDWGIDSADNKAEMFLKTISALVSPAAFAIKYLMADNTLNILGLIKLPSYAGYQYAFIALLEALSCPNILTYEEYYESTLLPDVGNANAIYNLVSPILGLLDKVYADPINTVLELIPNLLFFVSIGGLNDLLNNLVHFAYVILDVLKPIVNGYDILNGLISNIQIGGMMLNLTLPLDIDFNGLASDLIGSLVGDSLKINGVSISLPYIDFHTLCCGTLEKFQSKEIRTTVHLNSAGGGDMITAVLRLAFEIVFMEENKTAVCKIIGNAIGEGKLDVYDEETLYVVLDGLYDLMETYQVPDMLLYVIYVLVTKLTPVTTDIAPRFAANGLTIKDFIASAKDPKAFIENLNKILSKPDDKPSGDETPDKDSLGGLWARIAAFFKRLAAFFQKLFKH